MKNKKSIESELIQSLKEVRDFARGEKALTTKTRELPPPAPTFKSSQIKRLRTDVLDLTQIEFAQVLNVSVAAIRSWEQGVRKPDPAVHRLLEIIKKKPQIVSELSKKGA